MLLLLLSACRVELGPPGQARSDARPKVWVYTAIYQDQVDQFAAAVAKDLPDVDVEWFQGGSEKIAQRWEAEHSAGGSPACVLATSDPSWYVELADRGLLHAYVSPRALELPRAWVAPYYAPHRIDLMVMGVPRGAEAPKRFTELADPKWKGRFSSGDPFSSGTSFTTVAAWDTLHGAGFLEALDANGWLMAGGNSAVLGRIESQEKPVGIVLLNNLLYRRDATDIAYPEDGAIPIPGSLAITENCADKEAAEDVVDWLMGPTAQALVVKNGMHSPFPGADSPEGTPHLDAIVLAPLPETFQADTAHRSDELRARLEVLQR